MKVTATARRAGDWWAIEVPEVPGAFSQTKRLEQAAEEAADAVAVMLDIDPASVEVFVDVALSDEVATAVTQARSLAAAAEQAQTAASTAMRSVVATLRGSAGLSVRDVGALLGLSHQRVAQLEDKELSTFAKGARSSAGKGPRRMQASPTLSRPSKAPTAKVPAKKVPPVKKAAAAAPAKTAAARKGTVPKKVTSVRKGTAKPTRQVTEGSVTGHYVTKSAAARSPRAPKG